MTGIWWFCSNLISVIIGDVDVIHKSDIANFSIPSWRSKINFENIKRALDVKAGKSIKTAKIRDQAFPATRMPLSPNTSGILGQTWK
jgi:hypothetical protein